MSLRKLVLVAHRWIGISVGIFFGIASLTGALLVIEPALRGPTTRDPAALTPGDVGAGAVETAVLAAHPHARFALFLFPQSQPGAYRIDLIDEDARHTVWVDAGSGTFIEASGGSWLFTVVRRAHTTLLAGRQGHWVVLLSSVLALFTMAAGVVLWWPGIRAFWTGFVLRVRRGFYLMSFDLHRVVGIAALPLLVVMTLTGVLISFDGVARRLAHAVYLDFAPPSGPIWPDPPLTRPAEGSVRFDLRPTAALDEALRRLPDARPLAIDYPREPRRAIEARLIVGGAPPAISIGTVLFDPLTGEVAQVRDPRALSPAMRLYAEGLLRLHVGGYKSVALRSLYLLACLAGGFLVPTGYIIWWLKRRRKASAQRRRVGP